MGFFMKPKTILLILAMLLHGCAGDESEIEQPRCNRWILEDDVTNARELGGHALAGGGYVDCGKIMRGGHLGDLSEDGCQEFSDLGIKTVIDLRMDSEQQQTVPLSCVTDQATVVDASLPKLDPSTDNYVALLDETSTVAAVFTTLGDANSYPVYIHCMIGRDRASTMTALVLMALGVPNQAVVDEFDLNNDAGVSVNRDYIQAVIVEVVSRGGIDAYLTSTGVTTTQLEVLRAEVIKD